MRVGLVGRPCRTKVDHGALEQGEEDEGNDGDQIRQRVALADDGGDGHAHQCGHAVEEQNDEEEVQEERRLPLEPAHKVDEGAHDQRRHDAQGQQVEENLAHAPCSDHAR